ncbi:ATP-binding cassette domain-containing protein [Streptomyces sp.]|uniref:ATP-binding cassette domain-containing protein n=1 Tax=Streptomyces sp. TaxID=1931 RepID=UPI002F3FD0F0
MPTLFRLENIGIARGGTVVLRGLHARIRSGRCTALLGPSGVGKSTLLRLLVRLEEPAQGRIMLDDRPLASHDVRELRRRVGFVQQQPIPLMPTVLADLRVGRPALTEEEAVDLLERVGLTGDWLGRDRRSLSGGESQRVCLARALAVGPEAVLLDEPTAALDPVAGAAVEEVLHGLKASGVTTVLVSHNLDQAKRLADDVIILSGGELAATGPADEVFAGPADERARLYLKGSLT